MDAGLIFSLVWPPPVVRKFPIRPEWIEFLAGLLAGALIVALCSRRPGFLDRVATALRRTARRRALWIVIFALLGPCIRLALLPLAPMPFPVVQDESVHLLEASTFLHGRLANPPNALPDFFETIYVIQSPTYSATYPPGNAAFLALGWKLTGEPWPGVWLSMVLCCGAVAWMQYRWLPPLAAWIGGLLCTLSLGISSYWMNSYFGGAIPAAGGALLFGALPALLRTARLRYAVILSAGWTLVWFTRPYESVLLGLLTGAAVMVWLWRRGSPKLFTGALFIIGVVALDFAGFCYQNWRVTGDPLLNPYRLTQRRYGVPHAFLWQKEIPEPPNLTPQQRRVYLYQRHDFRTARSLTRRWPLLAEDLKKVWGFFIGYPLTIPFALGLVASSRKTRILWLLLAAGVVWSSFYPRVLVNYLSPGTGLFFALASYGLLRLSRWRPRGRPWGAALALGCILGGAASATRLLYPWYLYGGPLPPTARETVARQLDAAPGQHLVFVRYGPDHSVHDEWVYNRAGIDHAKVVWANDLGAERDRQLIQYFGGRHVWLAEPDNGQLTPYAPRSDGFSSKL